MTSKKMQKALALAARPRGLSRADFLALGYHPNRSLTYMGKFTGHEIESRKQRKQTYYFLIDADEARLRRVVREELAPLREQLDSLLRSFGVEAHDATRLNNLHS